MKTPLSQPHPSLRTGRWWCLGFWVAACLFPATPALRAATVTINAATTYQVIDGFGVNINHWNTNEIAPVLDALIDQAGMTLFRVIYDRTDWEANNDNNDANLMNWGYYNGVYTNADFQKLWDTVAYLNQKGIVDGVMLNFMGRGPGWMVNNSLITGYEAEWAEMIASLVYYARNNRHLQFGLLAPDNEPDNTSDSKLQRVLMSMSQYVTANHILAQLLDANGLSDVRLVGPDLAYPSTDWLTAMMADPVIMAKVAHFGMHSYWDNGVGSAGVYSLLQQSAYRDRSFWMTEYNAWCPNCETCTGGDGSWGYARSSASYLINHLANGASAGLLFTGYDTYFDYLGCWSYWGLFAVNDINAATKTFTPRKTFYTMSQISKFIRPGARRIDLSGYTTPLNVLAFYHPATGQFTITGVNPDVATTLYGTLLSLGMVSSLDLYYTSATMDMNHSGSVPVVNGAFAASIPGDCVFTLVASPSVVAQISSPAEGARFVAPAAIPLLADASTSVGSIVKVEFFSGTNKLGETPSAPYNLTWSNVPPGTYALSARGDNSYGSYASSLPVHVTVLPLTVQIAVQPNNAKVVPYGTQQFTAVATDPLGTPLVPQPSFSWAVSGGGVIDSNGLFTAGRQFSGPFTVTASGRGTNGAGTVSVVSNGKPILPPQNNFEVTEGALLTVTNTAVSGSFVGRLTTSIYDFTYPNRQTFVYDGWSFVATQADGTTRDTENIGSVVSYDQVAHPGLLRVPCDRGDLWGTDQMDTRNSLFRNLPTNWLSLDLSLAFAPNADYMQAHLGVYQDDDNYVQVGVAYNSYSGGESMPMDCEVDGLPNAFARATTTATNFHFRIDRNQAAGLLVGLYSVDGTNWNVLGQTNQTFPNPRLAIWAGGSSVAYVSGMPTVDLRRLTIVLSNAVPASLAYALSNPPAGASIDTNGVITWQPGESQGPGTSTLITVVSDNNIPPSRATNQFTVVVHEVNTAPVLPPQADRVLTASQTLVVTNTAADTDIPANPLSYQLTRAPAGAAIDANGVITWTPTPSQAPSTNVFTTRVTDFNPNAVNNQQLSATNNFTVTVAPISAAPILSASVANNSLVITWDALSGLNYRLQYRTNLADGEWQDLPPNLTGSGPTTSATNAIGDEPARFYRVLMAP
jgi:O-glycosyl hydrolase